MRRPTAYFLGAVLGAVACLILLIFKQGEGPTPLALFAVWTVTMLVLGLRERA